MNCLKMNNVFRSKICRIFSPEAIHLFTVKNELFHEVVFHHRRIRHSVGHCLGNEERDMSKISINLKRLLKMKLDPFRVNSVQNI